MRRMSEAPHRGGANVRNSTNAWEGSCSCCSSFVYGSFPFHEYHDSGRGDAGVINRQQWAGRPAAQDHRGQRRTSDRCCGGESPSRSQWPRLDDHRPVQPGTRDDLLERAQRILAGRQLQGRRRQAAVLQQCPCIRQLDVQSSRLPDAAEFRPWPEHRDPTSGRGIPQSRHLCGAC
jgi:hypothetical protein